MKERPITFSTDMVRAILDGRKTQTRRVIKPQPEISSHGNLCGDWLKRPLGGLLLPKVTDIVMHCPYGQTGDRLWVSEAFLFGHAPNDEPGQGIAVYADRSATYHPNLAADRRNWARQYTKKPSIHMPRWASRITLQITDVRVERVQDITEDEAFAAGVQAPRTGPSEWGEPPEAVYEFMRLWDSINAARGYSWESNPWTWVIEFERVNA